MMDAESKLSIEDAIRHDRLQSRLVMRWTVGRSSVVFEYNGDFLRLPCVISLLLDSYSFSYLSFDYCLKSDRAIFYVAPWELGLESIYVGL